MSVQVPSSGSIIEIPAPPPVYETFQYGSSLLRFEIKQLKSVDRTHCLLSVIWLAITTIMTTILALWIVVLVGLSAVTVTSVLAVAWRKDINLTPTLKLTTAVIFFTVTLLNNHYQLVKWTYANLPIALIWTIIAVISHYKIPTKIFLIMIAAQLILLSIKLDQLTDIGWDTCVFPLFATYIIMYFGSFLLSVTLIVSIFRAKSEYSYRKQGYAYILIHLITFSISAHGFCEYLRTQELSKLFLATIICLCLSPLPPISYFIFRRDIKVFFSQITDSHITKIIRVAHLVKIPRHQQPFLKCISSNYYIREVEPQSNDSTMSLEQTKQNILCTICLAQHCNTIVMPCGHLTACFSCLAYYLDKSDTKCLICKTEIKQVCKVQASEAGRVKIIEQYGVRYR